MNLRERLGLREQSGETLDEQTFCIPAFKHALNHTRDIPYKTALATSYALLELAIPLTARNMREGSGMTLRTLLPITVDLFTKNLVGDAFNSGDDLTSAAIMGIAAIIVRSGASHLVMNVLQNNLRKPQRSDIPLQFQNLGPIA